MSFRPPALRIAATAAIAFALLSWSAFPLAAQPSAGRPEIAVIDTEKILTDSKLGKSVLASIETLRKQRKAELDGKNEAVEQLRERIAGGQQTLAQGKLAEIQSDLDRQLGELRRAQEAARTELEELRDDRLAEIDRKVMPIIQQIGKESGYVMIFRKFESGLVYAADSADITAEVIRRLDTP